MFLRIVAGIVLFLSVFWAPYWWVTAVLAVIFLFLFPYFWEAVLMAVLIDSLYGGWYFTAGFLTILFIIERFKKNLIAYDL